VTKSGLLSLAEISVPAGALQRTPPSGGTPIPKILRKRDIDYDNRIKKGFTLD